MEKSNILTIFVIFLAVLAFSFSQSVFEYESPPGRELMIKEYDLLFVDGIFANEGFLYANIKFDVPSPCHEVKTSVVKSENDIIFMLNFHETSEACIQVISEEKMLLVYGPLESGTYNIQVILSDKNGENQEIIYEERTFSL